MAAKRSCGLLIIDPVGGKLGRRPYGQGTRGSTRPGTATRPTMIPQTILARTRSPCESSLFVRSKIARFYTGCRPLPNGRRSQSAGRCCPGGRQPCARQRGLLWSRDRSPPKRRRPWPADVSLLQTRPPRSRPYRVQTAVADRTLCHRRIADQELVPRNTFNRNSTCATMVAIAPPIMAFSPQTK